MNASQFSKADFQNYDEEGDSGERTRKTDPRLLYVGLVTFIAILVIFVVSIFTCKIPIFNKFLPFCPKAPPTITKIFSPNSIEVNEVSTLTFTLGNSNSVALTGVTFTDALPFGLQVDDLPSATTTCGGGPTWAPSTGTMTLVFGSPAGGTIPANSSCLVSVNIKGTVPGSYQSVSGYISSLNGGVNLGNTGSATASLTVNPSVKSPKMTESFVPNQIPSNNTSTLTFKINNQNPDLALTSVTFSNTYPDGLTNTTPLNTTNTCEGTLTAAAGGNSVKLSEGAVSAAGTCIVTVNVTASNRGSYANTSVVLSTNVGAGNIVPDTLYVGDPSLNSINFLKEVSTSADGPWVKFINVSPGANIYYRFIIENKGIAPFYQFSVTDPIVNTASCKWPVTLPVAVPSNRNHIATCVVGPVAAVSGTHANTATASGSYADKPYTTASSTAIYGTETALNLYLPEILEPASSHIQDQLDNFKDANPGVTIIVNYLNSEEIQKIPGSNLVGLVALESRDVINFAEQELLLPVAALQSDQNVNLYLEDALNSVTFPSTANGTVFADGPVFAFPWQRDSCSPRYLSLAIFAKNPPEVTAVAVQLSAFLSNATNQQSNLQEQKLQWYPTLNQFYDSQQVICNPISRLPEEPSVNRRAVELARSLATGEGFLVRHGIHINFYGAVGFNPTWVPSDSQQLLGMLAPVIDANQKYTDREGKIREVEGIFNINDSELQPDTIVLINKSASEYPPLPFGSYMLACNHEIPDVDNCLAISLDVNMEGEEFQINPGSITMEPLFPNPNISISGVKVPNAFYEIGSWKGCFPKIGKFQICITLGRHKSK